MPKKNKKKNKTEGKPKNPDGVGVSRANNRINVEYLENPVKCEQNKNAYRVIKLPNGLVALLIACPCPVPSNENDSCKNDKAGDDKRIDCGRLENDDYPESYKKVKIHKERSSSMAICRLCINVGCFSDPRQVPGTSRLLSGTFNKPVFREETEMSDNYKKLAKYLDIDNGVIEDGESTIFGFCITEQLLPEAIDFLAQSFVSSLTTRYSVITKRQYMETKYKAQIAEESSDYVNENCDVLVNLLSARHPVRKCSKYYLDGLCHTTDDKMYKEVLKFRKRHYSAHRMTVVIKARIPLDLLESYAKDHFSKIPSNGLPPQSFNPFNFANSFDNTKFRKIWAYDDPICDNGREGYYETEVNWIMPPANWLYRSKSLDYIAWLINHRGKGSLVAYLAKKKWYHNFWAGSHETDLKNNSVYSLFSVRLTLTEEGHKNKKNILDALYSYINLLKLEGPQERIYNEIANIQQANFRFQEVDDQWDDDCCTQLAKNMHRYSSDDYLTGPFYYYEYDMVSITTCMDLMTPTRGCIIENAENFLKFVKNTALPCNTEEGHQCAEIPENWIEHWKMIEPMPEFKLPPVNIFCADNYTLIDPPKVLSKYPLKVYSDNLCELWYKFDGKFQLPKCHINLCYVSPLPSKSVKNAVMLNLYVDVLKHLINEELYPATFAGLSYEMEESAKGLVVKANGFNEKLPLLTQTIAKYIPECWNLVTQSLFDDVKEKQLKILDEKLYKSAQLANDIRNSILIVGQWTVYDRRTSLESIEFDKFKNFIKHYIDHVYVECLVQGNISEIDAIENIRKCVESSKCGTLLPSTMPAPLSINEIPRGKSYCRVKGFQPGSHEIRVQNYYQFANPSITLRVMIDLLIMIWTDHRFAELNKYRTSLISYVLEKNSFNAVGYTLQNFEYSKSMGNSDEKLISMEEKIDERRKFFNKLSKDLSDNELQRLKKIMLDARSKTDDVLCFEVERNWREISTGECFFDRQTRAYDVISRLELEDFRKWMSTLTEDGINVRKLSVQVVAREKAQQNASNGKIERNLMNEKAQQNNRNTMQDLKKSPCYQLNYLLGEFPKSKETMTCYYITDIEKYKNELKVLTTSRNVSAK